MARILIAGAGISGSYLLRLLIRRGVNPKEIEIVDPSPKTRCGIAPCGFAATSHFIPLCQEVGLNPEKYILRSLDVGYLDKIRIEVKGTFSIDKPAFIRDLLEGVEVASSPSGIAAERIIDATGIARAYIGEYDSDLLVPGLQRKVEFPHPPQARECLHHVGYSWVIPLEGNSAHVGIGSMTYDIDAMRKAVEELAEGAKTICSCQGYVRSTGPILPLVQGNIWAVGEAGGIAEPLSGAGMVPAMVSAKLLVEHWDDPEGYEAAILREYGWFRKTAAILYTWRNGGLLPIWDLGLWKKCAEFVGFKPNISYLIYRYLVLIVLQLPSVLQLLRSARRS
jgi:flavin-dependent dehydrogenase